MKFLSEKRVSKINLGSISFEDVLEHLENEKYYDEGLFSLDRKIDKDWIVLRVERDKITPSQTYEFRYNRTEKILTINGKYNNVFFPGLLMNILPLSILFFGQNVSNGNQKKIILMMLFITMLVLIVGYFGLRMTSKEIQRDLNIRINYLMRKKGMTNFL